MGGRHVWWCMGDRRDVPFGWVGEDGWVGSARLKAGMEGVGRGPWAGAWAELGGWPDRDGDGDGDEVLRGQNTKFALSFSLCASMRRRQPWAAPPHQPPHILRRAAATLYHNMVMAKTHEADCKQRSLAQGLCKKCRLDCQHGRTRSQPNLPSLVFQQRCIAPAHQQCITASAGRRRRVYYYTASRPDDAPVRTVELFFMFSGCTRPQRETVLA